MFLSAPQCHIVASSELGSRPFFCSVVACHVWLVYHVGRGTHKLDVGGCLSGMLTGLQRTRPFFR